MPWVSSFKLARSRWMPTSISTNLVLWIKEVRSTLSSLQILNRFSNLKVSQRIDKNVFSYFVYMTKWLMLILPVLQYGSCAGSRSLRFSVTQVMRMPITRVSSMNVHTSPL